MTATDLTERGRLARHASMRSAEKTLRGGMLQVSLWYWAVIVVVCVVVAVLQNQFSALDGSTLQYTLGSARYFLFTLGMILAVVVLPAHVAAGGTRRSFVEGLIRGALVVGLVTGLVVAVLLLGEELVWGAIGWQWEFAHGLVPEGSFVVDLVSEAIVTATYVLAGAILPAAFQRLGAWGGTFMVLVLLGLLVLCDWTVRTGYFFGWNSAGVIGPGGVALGLGAGVLVLAVAALGVHRFYRDIPLRSAVN